MVMSAVLITVLAGCPVDTGGSDDGQSEVPSHEKFNPRNQRIIHTVWTEQGVDNREVLGYRLEDGRFLFDHNVQLYALRLRDRNCSNHPELLNCNRTGLHICFDDSIYDRIITRYDEVIKPIREAGIKVIFSIVPRGVCVGNLYHWPMEEWYPWSEIEGEEEYAWGPAAVERLMEQLVQIYRDYPFDGIGYDEEYGFTGGALGRGEVYPNTRAYPGINELKAWSIGGGNILRFAHEFNLAIGKTNDEVIHESYEIKYSSKLPPSYTYPEDWPLPEGAPRTIYRDDLIDISYEPYYGSWQANSQNNLPRSRYGPIAIDLGFNKGGPLPPSGRSGIQSLIGDHLRLNYGVVMYYGLRERDDPHYFPSYFGPDNPLPETYLSQITQILHGMDTIYISPY